MCLSPNFTLTLKVSTIQDVILTHLAAVSEILPGFQPSNQMKTFHVSILYSTANGPLVKTHTFKADRPDVLSMKIQITTECTEQDKGWVFIAAHITEIKETINVNGLCDLALAN